jgi:Tfp pilus assembly protein PilV
MLNALPQRGVTIAELLIAVVVLTVGLLGLTATSALVTRMIARAHRTTAAATFAAQRLERLRITGCAQQTAGADTLRRGAVWIAINNWSFSSPFPHTWRILLHSTYQTQQGRAKTETIETAISCVP